MELGILIVFILGYTGIAFEHVIKINKTPTALITGALCWTILLIGATIIPEHLVSDYSNLSITLGQQDVSLSEFFNHRLLHHLQEIAAILIFLMAAMTIVEVVDAHEGFNIITDKITSTSKVKLLWIVSIITFFLSAALDNLTTAIVMVSLVSKLIDDKKTRWFFGGMIVIAANSGGAWSPIGDVTTTMLWIGKQITTVEIIKSLFLPSLVSLLVPLSILSLIMKGNVNRPENKSRSKSRTTKKEKLTAFFLGIGGLLFVPIFKNVTHLPPFMGIILSLGIVWLVTEIMHSKKEEEVKDTLSALHALRKIDMPSVLFFLGILLAVSALQEVGHLQTLATTLKETLNNPYAINMSIGGLSAIVDNVPLVAASMNMYDISPAVTNDSWSNHFVQDGVFWHFLAYCAGTGGSMLIIGSAAGVAVMGIQKIDFMWYLKNISLWALIGYISGGIVYIIQNM